MPLLIHSPQEFNTTQRSQFCVFAGEGVNKLRQFLTDLLNSITEEMNPQGDDDVGDSISYVHDDDSMDIDEVPPRVTILPPSPPVLQEQSPITAPIYQPTVRVQGASARDIEMATLRVERPRSSRNSRSRTRSQTHTPPPVVNPTPGPSRVNPTTERFPTSPAASEGSSAGAFFRTYQSNSADGRPDGALTPDLIFAEIGHGHGPTAWHSQGQNQNHTYQLVDPTMMVDDRPQYGASPSHARSGAWRAATQAVGVGQGPFGTNGAFLNGTTNGTHHTNTVHSSTTNGATAHGGPPVTIQGPPMAREERSRGRQRTSREPQESVQPAPTPGQSQGRGPKRIFRNTLNSVEQHASSFLFGRPLQDGESSSAGANGRKDDGTRGY